MSDRSKKLKNLNELEQELRKRPLSGMPRRGEVEGELQQVEAGLRGLIIAYEQYFMGIDKFEPAKERQVLALRLRRLVNSYIPQTDLRFRLQGLASRLQSYAAYWDRILRLIEEGRYERQRSHMKWAAQLRPPEPDVTAASPPPADPLDKVYRELVDAYASCHLAPPRREQIEEFLARQQDAIRERFGDRPIEIKVVVTEGKPRLKVVPRG